ncbi:unnamed protein product [Alopecurus aequalis]
MASIVCKLARAAFATHASPSAVGGSAGGGRPAAAIRVFSAGGPKSEEKKAKPNSKITYLDVDDKVLESDEAMWAFYEYWCKYHSISRDPTEMARRFKTFSDNARRVHKFNNTCPNGKCSMNHMADWTKKERSQLRGKRPVTK